MRRAAQEEVYRRGQESTRAQEVITRLQALGYEVLSPEDLAGDSCPWCNAPY
jgi:hypothetical protein